MNPIYVIIGNTKLKTAEQADVNCSSYVVLESMKAKGYTVDSILYDVDLFGWVVFTRNGPYF